MRVRISYSVELEEVPEQSSKLLEEALDNVHRVMVNIQNIQDGKVPNELLLQNLEEVRFALTKIDYSVTDAGMIMKGYLDAKEQMNNQSQLQEHDSIDKALEGIEKERTNVNEER